MLRKPGIGADGAAGQEAYDNKAKYDRNRAGTGWNCIAIGVVILLVTVVGAPLLMMARQDPAAASNDFVNQLPSKRAEDTSRRMQEEREVRVRAVR